MKTELTKAKKTLRDKEKELNKLKGELTTFKVQKFTGNSENTSTAMASATNNIPAGEIGGVASGNGSGNGSVPRKDSNSWEKEVKQLQKRVRDLTVETKAKKEKVEEQDGVIKKLQERLQTKIDESAIDQKKLKDLQE